MDIDRHEATAIRDELQRWHDEARSLINDASDKSRLSATSIDSLKSRLVRRFPGTRLRKLISNDATLALRSEAPQRTSACEQTPAHTVSFGLEGFSRWRWSSHTSYTVSRNC